MSKPGDAPAARKPRLIWLVAGLIFVELVGVVGLVVVLSGGLEQVALIAVCAALIVVPLLFGIALRSEIKGQSRER